MKIVQITPGSGDNFYCENCLRDRALVKALRAQGHDVVLVPLYLPLQAESREALTDVPIFFGGVNVYLQQKLGLFRHTPRWLDRLFDHPRLLGWAASKTGMTRAHDLGQTTLSMLRGPAGRQAKELDRLLAWLRDETDRPAVIVLSNILLGGLARPLREALGVPVVCLLQDEEGFVDSLGEPYAERAWDLLRTVAAESAALIAVSDTYARRIGPRLSVSAAKLHVVPMGLDLSAYTPVAAPPAPRTVGFLSRTCALRGLDTLVEAFGQLADTPAFGDLQLAVSGGHTQADAPFLQHLRARIAAGGWTERVRFEPEFLGDRRARFLSGLTALCVPEREAVAYGLHTLEALASGVPVVVPALGVFPELLERTGGGVLVSEPTPAAYAAALRELLNDPARARALGRAGRAGMEQHYDVRHTGTQLIDLLDRVVREASV